jgi:hypothetical protein
MGMGLGPWRWTLLYHLSQPPSCFSLFPFPVSTAQFIGEFWKDRRSGMSDLVPILLALFKKHSYIIGAAFRLVLLGEAVSNRRAFRRSGKLLQRQN